MKEKINIAELLKDCPKGMKLDCTMWEDVTFDSILESSIYPIRVMTPDGLEKLTEYGSYSHNKQAKCVIFPEGKDTWERFIPPCKFENGDILTAGDCIFIFKELHANNSPKCYCHYDLTLKEFKVDTNSYLACGSEVHLATKEQQDLLFSKMEGAGYKWNAKTKTLEKLNVPKFKVGVRIKKRKDYISGTIISITDDGFYKVEHQNGSTTYVNITYQDEWELVPVEPKFKVGNRITNGKASITIGYIDDNYYYEIGRNIASRISITEQEQWRLDKFDISTLVPFESKVLVRDMISNTWKPAIFGCIKEKSSCPFVTLGGVSWVQCIPLEGNKHLFNKKDDCDEYYKTWEE